LAQTSTHFHASAMYAASDFPAAMVMSKDFAAGST
jgi:hypothetical protein